MANVYAVKSGNWSDTTVWNTGALPTSADDVYSNTFTVTIDVSPTVLSIRNGSATGVTQGGSFSITANGITLTLTGSGLVATGTSANVLNVNNSVGTTVNLIFNSMSMTVVSQSLASFTGSGTLNITGNITVTSSIWANGFYLNGTGTVNITGDLTASPSSSNGGGPVFAIANTNTVNITGALNANLGFVISHGGTGQCTHIGSVNASNGKYAIAGTGRYVLSGPFLTSSNGKNPVIAENWFWANSNVTPTYYQIRTANLATIRPLYTADSVGGNPAASNVRSGTVYGPAGELTGTCAVPPAGSVALGVPVDNTTGTAYITANDIATALSSASAVTLNQQTSSLTTPGSIGERLKLASTVATTAQQLSDALSNE